MKFAVLTACFAALCFGQSSAGRGWWEVSSNEQTSEGHIYHLRGHAEIRGSGMVLRADQIDYDEAKAVMHLAGHVTIETDTISVRADDVDYDTNSSEVQARQGHVSMKLKQVPAR
jgi:lipopolysaccharide assembly outer membrane protein LptD (OstA)